jgi:hypothetical protein
LNYDSKISDATSFENKTIKTNAAVNWALGKAYMPVKNKGADSSLIRVVHNFVKPDPFKSNPQGHKLSDQHYWTVEGILSPGFHAHMTFNYDGNKTQNGAYAYLDTLLTPVNGDSVRVFYRQNSKDDWKLVKNCVIIVSGTKSGYIQIDTLKLGQYTLGNSTDLVTINSVNEETSFLKVKLYPNPANHTFKIEFENSPAEHYQLSIVDINGKVVLSKQIRERLNAVNVSSLAKGTYFVRVASSNEILYSQKVLVE